MTTIDGLWVHSEAQQEVIMPAALRAGTPDVAEAVGVTILAYTELGATPDVDVATESLTNGFTALTGLGYDGRLYTEPPKGVSFDHLIATADSKKARGVDTVYRWPNLWTPGTEANSYTVEELNGSPAEAPEARLAVFNAKKTGVDPTLHFLDIPYDDKYRNGAPQTQLEAIDAASAEFALKHPETTLQALGHRAVVMNVLMDRIRGIKRNSTDFILNQGYMRIPELGRREVDGGSVVGYVDSIGSQLGLDRSYGRASSFLGVGLSVGRKEIDPQTS